MLRRLPGSGRYGGRFRIGQGGAGAGDTRAGPVRSATGPGRITEALAAELANNPESVNLLVTAKFPPERFHSNVYNDIGVQRGTEGTTTIVARVTPSNVRWISKQYWVTQVDLAPKK